MNFSLTPAWFYWALGVVVGLPVGLVVLTELQNSLSRRGSGLARPIGLIRNYILPLAALLALLTKANQVPVEATSVRIIATVFGFAILILLLSGLNATLFESAPQGSWRRRMPSIFLDVARFLVIAAGLAMIMSYVWGANVGGLFTALGITSIVLGLTLQNSVGQIISGLFVLFEQPFQLDDWISTPTARGRVAEVNWRSTHIDTGSGLQIMPNSVLAVASFTNLSRPPGAHQISVETVFSVGDPPDEVCQLLTGVAGMLPQCRTDVTPSSAPAGGTGYTTSIPLRTPADDSSAKSTFLRWVWYAARRAGLHLDEADDDFTTPERVDRALHIMAPALRLTASDQEEMRPHIRMTRYGAAETLQSTGQVPEYMTCVVDGRVQLTVNNQQGVTIPLRTLKPGDLIGQTVLTREPVQTVAYALVETAVVHIERQYLEELVHRKPLLLQDIARTIDKRRAGVQRALTSTDVQVGAAGDAKTTAQNR